jgi:uncharacterized RDD family membrane protein YckC/predicted Ser/Thr protein kinase
MQPLFASEAGASRVLAHYELLEKIGQGGMGTVYCALDTLLDRRVAVKVLSTELSASEEFRQRFTREAKILAHVAHPNIPHTYFVGRSGGRFFFAMEWIEGDTLESIGRHGSVPVTRALDIVQQVASGLAFAHRARIIHRDIKPSNIMVTPDGLAKILDFGIARSETLESESPDAGAFIGTPQYASPEQARGERLDARTDIYSLGATLFEMLAGRMPFAGDAPLADRLEKPPPEVPPECECAPEVRALIRRSMARDPNERFQDCDELLRAIDGVYPGPAVVASLGRRASAFAIDIMAGGVPLAAVSVGFFAAEGYLLSTYLYDSLAGRLALHLGTLAWLLVYFILLVDRHGRTLGQRVEDVRRATLDGRKPTRAQLLLHSAAFWGPAWLLTARGSPVLVEGQTVMIKGPWLLAGLWVVGMALTPLLTAGRRNVADRIAGIRIVQTARRLGAQPVVSAARGVVHYGSPHRRRDIPVRAAAGVAWLCIAILAGLQLRPLLWGTAPWKVVETIPPGTRSWDRLLPRFIEGAVQEGQRVVNPDVLSFRRGLLVPTLWAQLDSTLVIEDRVSGVRICYHSKEVRFLAGGEAQFGGDAIWWAEALTPMTKSEALDWDQRRREDYRGSSAHFLRSLLHGHLATEGFQVLNPEAFIGVFRAPLPEFHGTPQGEDRNGFVLVAGPELRVRVQGLEETGLLELPSGFIWIDAAGNVSGDFRLRWGFLTVPDSMLWEYAKEQDRVWGRGTASIERVLELH